MLECALMDTNLSISRRDVIASRLAAGHAVVAGSLATEFAVSEDAIRRDLRALAAEGLCRRVYGGALPISPATIPLSVRLGEDASSKLALARAGVGSIHPRDLIFLDSGSTNLAVVEALPEDAELTVATNAPDIAAMALRRGDLSVIMVGGMVDPVNGGCVDSIAVRAVARMRFDRAFIGACAISATGVSAFHLADATFKRVVITQSEQVIVLATTDKLGGGAPHEVASFAQVGLLVIEASATEAQRAALDAGGCVRLLIADPA